MGRPFQLDRRQEELLAYWKAQRDTAFAPPRARIDPADLRQLLPWIALLDVEAGSPPVFRYRLVGTALDQTFGAPLTGMLLSDAWAAPLADGWLGWLRRVLTGHKPALCRAIFQFGEGSVCVGSLFLPLSTDGEQVDRVLCGVAWTATSARTPPLMELQSALAGWEGRSLPV